jgi:hypothetical protein
LMVEYLVVLQGLRGVSLLKSDGVFLG